MFWNSFRKQILRSLRSKDIVIWTLMFPILLSVLFHFAFASLENEGALSTIPVGVVEDEAYKSEVWFGKMMDTLGMPSEGEDAFLEVLAVSGEEEADLLLKEEKVDGYIVIKNGNPRLFVKKSGINQTVLKNLLDRYIRTRESIIDIMKKNPKALGAWALEAAVSGVEMKEEDYFEEVSFSGRKPSVTVTYYYSLLAMTCLFGGFHGIMIVSSLQANLSPQGARNTLSPGSRGRLFGALFLAALATLSCCMIVVLCFIRFVLGVSFGGQFGYAVLACILGSGVGISFGCMISLPSRWKFGMKISMVVFATLFCSYLAGLMVSGINYIVQEKAPILAAVNPAARISDAFYCLYYYDSHGRYWLNMGILVLMTAVMFGVSAVFVRRKQYESI